MLVLALQNSGSRTEKPPAPSRAGAVCQPMTPDGSSSPSPTAPRLCSYSFALLLFSKGHRGGRRPFVPPLKPTTSGSSITRQGLPCSAHWHTGWRTRHQQSRSRACWPRVGAAATPSPEDPAPSPGRIPPPQWWCLRPRRPKHSGDSHQPSHPHPSKFSGETQACARAPPAGRQK